MVANAKPDKKLKKSKKGEKQLLPSPIIDDEKKENQILFKRTLEAEAELINLDETLREMLSVKNPKKNEAKDCLDKMASLTVSGLILKKNPHIVDDMKKCKKYKYDSEIQEKADIVYKKFKLLFLVPENVDWDTLFEEKVRQFEEACSKEGITEENKIFLVSDPTHPCFNAVFLQMHKNS